MDHEDEKNETYLVGCILAVIGAVMFTLISICIGCLLVDTIRVLF